MKELMNRSRVTSGLLGAAALAAVVATGCGGSPATAADGAALFSCETETRDVDYMPDLTRTAASGRWQVVLMTSEPGPPVKGTNTWTVKLLDDTGAPRDDVPITVRTFMPDHNHGSTIKASVTPMGNGVFRVSPLYLYMPGLWQVTLDLDAPNAPDNVMFPICIPG
jgi:hypothetical protein